LTVPKTGAKVLLLTLKLRQGAAALHGTVVPAAVVTGFVETMYPVVFITVGFTRLNRLNASPETSKLYLSAKVNLLETRRSMTWVRGNLNALRPMMSMPFRPPDPLTPPPPAGRLPGAFPAVEREKGRPLWAFHEKAGECQGCFSSSFL